MFKHCTLIIFGFIISYHCLSQDYREGYIIRNQNDTISGQIAYQPYAKYLKSCLFKADGIEHQYFPADIAGYGFDEGRYFASGIAKDKFVEAHIIGELSLYQSDTTFFLKKGTEIRELKTQTLAREIDGREGVMEDTKWKGIVSFMISDCIQNPMGRMATLKMQIKTLSKLAIEYNECRGSSYVDYGGTERRMKINLGLYAGYIRSSISVEDEIANQPDINSPYSEKYLSLDPSIGLLIRITFPRFSERVGLQIAPFYYKSSYQGFEQVQLGGDLYYFDSFFSITTVSIPLALNLQIPVGKRNRIMTDLGINYDILVKDESTVMMEEFNGINIITIFEDKSMFRFKKMQGGLYLGTGLFRSFGAFELGLNFQYFYQFQFDDQRGLSVSNDKMQLGFVLVQ
ncbi:MAG: hypothetical protein RLO17_02795 [Cyclobacteriaceae bacterium]